MEAGISIKLCKQFHYSLSNVHRTSAVSCSIYMSVLSTSLTESTDPYVQSLHKRINRQFRYARLLTVILALTFLTAMKDFITLPLQKKRKTTGKKMMTNLYVIWILIKYSKRVEQKTCIILFLCFILFSCKLQQANNLKNINSNL